MSALRFCLLIGVVLTLSNCSKNNDNNTSPNNITNNGNSNILFWSTKNIGSVEITCNSQIKNFDDFDSINVPECGLAAGATFDVVANTFNYSAKNDSVSWSGSVTVQQNECKKINLGLQQYSPLTNNEIIEGEFSGIVKYWPDSSLGTMNGCQLIDVSQMYVTGAMHIRVWHHFNDGEDTMRFQVTSNVFAYDSMTFSPQHIVRTGNILTFPLGNYNVTTKTLTFESISPYEVPLSGLGCDINLPHVSVITVNPPVFSYRLMEYIVFTGTKDH